MKARVQESHERPKFDNRPDFRKILVKNGLDPRSFFSKPALDFTLSELTVTFTALMAATSEYLGGPDK